MLEAKLRFKVHCKMQREKSDARGYFYRVECPTFNISGTGETKKEAQANLQRSIQSIIDTGGLILPVVGDIYFMSVGVTDSASSVDDTFIPVDGVPKPEEDEGFDAVHEYWSEQHVSMLEQVQG